MVEVFDNADDQDRKQESALYRLRCRNNDREQTAELWVVVLYSV
jgi:hypothetical protein